MSFSKLTLFVVFILSLHTAAWSQSDRVSVNGKDIFMSGGNIAWVNFARDVGPNSTSLSGFNDVFSDVKANNGNVLRFWVHINGTNTPAWSGDEVSGPGAGTIADLEAILDEAHDQNISLILCLWSFDMLQGAGSQTGLTSTQIAKNRGLLENEDKLQTYIDNALIPMVEALGNHPALAAWEVFNEPEGMSNEFNGWTPNKVDMSDVQVVVNKIAGAIHRTNENALVSNGAWSFHSLAQTSNGNSKNYYSDAELVSAGGDQDGTLDFYMVHYYDWGGAELSPFQHDVGHWNLDKPVVVGEFHVPNGNVGDGMYKNLYDRGYAGALAWSWSDNNFAESWINALREMQNMYELHPGDITLGAAGPTITSLSASKLNIAEGDSSLLSWRTIFANRLTLNGSEVNVQDSMYVSPLTDMRYEFIATSDTSDIADTASVTINVVAPIELNRALGKKAISSANESGEGNANPNFVTDGIATTRWSSPYEDNHWIYVDLESLFEVEAVLLNWEVAFGESYDIQVSTDAQNWTTVYEERSGNGGIDSLAFEGPHLARYVRMNGISRGTEFGFSLWEFKIFGLQSDLSAPEVQFISPRFDLSVKTGSPLVIRGEAADADGNLTYVSVQMDGDSVGVLDESTGVFNFDSLDEEGTYTVSLKAVDDTGLTFETEEKTITVDDDIRLRRFEAEAADTSGDLTFVAQSLIISGDGFIKMEESGSMRWNNIGLGDAQTFEVRIRYFLPFGTKKQNLNINEGEQIIVVTFDGSEKRWNTKDTTITTTSPITSLSLESGWGYMNVDYLELEIPESTSVEEENTLAQKLSLSQNYPNPFNPVTNIPFALSNTGHVTITVYDITGRKIETLADRQFSTGTHSVSWNASSVASGIYIYKMDYDGTTMVKSMTLIK